MAYARGRQSKAISDRSGMEFPYKEMVKEWNGSIVHFSEYEPKHPQLDPPYHKADAIALINPRPDVNRGTGIEVSLDPRYWDGQWEANGMRPAIDPQQMNLTREAHFKVGKLTVSIS